LCKQHPPYEPTRVGRSQIFQAAKEMKTICEGLHLEVITIQPLQSCESHGKSLPSCGADRCVPPPHADQVEGTLDPVQRKEKLAEASLYLELASLLGAKILQVTSHYDKEGTTGEIDVLAQDMALLADMAKVYGVKVAYEGICWAAHVNTWQAAWKVVQLANRDNLGSEL
jgi:sugar phosphate isomerase/epimerase